MTEISKHISYTHIDYLIALKLDGICVNEVENELDENTLQALPQFRIWQTLYKFSYVTTQTARSGKLVYRPKAYTTIHVT